MKSKILTKQNGMTRLALIIIIIAIISIISITVMVIKNANNEEVENQTITTDEKKNDSTTTSESDFKIPTLTILGKEYKFPMTVNELMELGWRDSEAFDGGEDDLRNRKDWMVEPNVNVPVFCSNDSIKYIQFYIDNNTDSKKPISECIVVGAGITYSVTTKKDGYSISSRKVVEIPDNSIKIGQTIVIGKTTPSEVIAELGTKNEYYTNLYTNEISYDNLDMLWYDFDNTNLSAYRHLSFEFLNGIINTFQFINR